MTITAATVKELREKTGVGMMKCKKALEEAGGDVTAAETILRKQGAASAEKKAGRVAGEGLISSYIHTGGKIGVLLEVNCETDFAARSEGFVSFVKGIAMHVAAANPRYLDRESVDKDVLDREREIASDQARQSGKPDNVVEKIVQGKIEKFYKENCLMEQPYVRDPDQTVTQLVTEAVGRIGENIKVRRYSRFVLGDEG
ncbi:MAG: translation elongation factor Ts [Acidobacteriota bacterium]|nr:translation elongation factor Ts [Acidobacteriota bacterium]MDH3785395.1 translation elongation factor Ts [Acidobacteriota bacterium]